MGLGYLFPLALLVQASFDDECDSLDGRDEDCALHVLQKTTRLRKIEPFAGQRPSYVSRRKPLSKNPFDFLRGNARVGMHRSLVPEATALTATKTWSMWSLSGPVRLGHEADVDAAPAVTDWLGSQEIRPNRFHQRRVEMQKE